MNDQNTVNNDLEMTFRQQTNIVMLGAGGVDLINILIPMRICIRKSLDCGTRSIFLNL